MKFFTAPAPHGTALPVEATLNSTSDPLAVFAVDDSTNAPVQCTWYLGAAGAGSASRPGSLNSPVVNGYANVGIDPTDPLTVQIASTAVTGTSVKFYPSNPSNRNASAKVRLVATSGGQTREMLISINS
jgi:hypothetical protein